MNTENDGAQKGVAINGNYACIAWLGINELNALIERIEWSGLDPSLRSRQDIHELLECARELKVWREGGVTEELLRRHDGYIKVGKGCVVALADMEK